MYCIARGQSCVCDWFFFFFMYALFVRMPVKKCHICSSFFPFSIYKIFNGGGDFMLLLPTINIQKSGVKRTWFIAFKDNHTLTQVRSPDCISSLTSDDRSLELPLKLFLFLHFSKINSEVLFFNFYYLILKKY